MLYSVHQPIKKLFCLSSSSEDGKWKVYRLVFAVAVIKSIAETFAKAETISAKTETVVAQAAVAKIVAGDWYGFDDRCGDDRSNYALNYGDRSCFVYVSG